MVELALRTKLTRARRYWAVLDALEGVGWILLALGVAGLLCFHADRAFVLSPGTRMGLRWASLFLMLLGAARLVLWPLLRKRSDEAIAIHVERRYPEFGERLLSTVEFEQANGVVPGTSPSMVRALADET